MSKDLIPSFKVFITPVDSDKYTVAITWYTSITEETGFYMHCPITRPIAEAVSNIVKAFEEFDKDVPRYIHKNSLGPYQRLDTSE